MVSAQLPFETHVNDLLDKKILKTRVPRPALFSCHHPVNEPEEFKSDVQRAVCACNIYEHTHTCYKGRTGRKRCRLSRSQQTVNVTGCVQLDPNRDDEDGLALYKILDPVLPPSVFCSIHRNAYSQPIRG